MAYDCVKKRFSDNQMIDRLIEDETLSQPHCCRRRQCKREVMDLILAGKLNKVIADALGITMRTIEVHPGRVFAKMSMRSAVELAPLNTPSP